jgi:hypothetical protein
MPERHRILLLGLLCWAGAVAQAAAPPLAVRVSGNHLIDAAGQVLQLRGANMSGLEYVPIQGWSAGNPWGGPAGDAHPDWKHMQEWGLNTLRIPLNAASWQGTPCIEDGGKARDPDPGHNYKAAVATAVKEAGEHGFYVILDLHWVAPGNLCPMAQNPRPDAENAVAFWKSVAGLYGQNPAVVLELFNEPFEDQNLMERRAMSWAGLRDGGDMDYFVTGGDSYKVPLRWKAGGLQLLLDTVRAAGAKNVVLASGLYWSKDLSEWPGYHPIDPLQQLGAVWHAYPKSNVPGSADAALPDFGMNAYRSAQAVLAAGFPLAITELGDRSANGTRGAPFVSQLLPWADQNAVSYTAWTWNPFGTDENALVKDNKGTPTDGFGVYYRQHNICRAAHPTTPCP